MNNKDVIIACDFNSKEALYAFLDNFTGKKPFLKIGMELFYAEGDVYKRQHNCLLQSCHSTGGGILSGLLPQSFSRKTSQPKSMHPGFSPLHG